MDVLKYLAIYIPQALHHGIAVGTFALLIVIWRRTGIPGFAVIAALMVLGRVYYTWGSPYLMSEFGYKVGLAISGYYSLLYYTVNFFAFLNIYIRLKNSGRLLAS